MEKLIHWPIFAFVFIIGCNSQPTEPTKRPTPAEVVAMEGSWDWEANCVVQRYDTTYNLIIATGTMDVSKTTSDDWPYELPATLTGTTLSCVKEDSIVWEVQLEGLPVDSYRAWMVQGCLFDISTPFGILLFDCQASYWDQYSGDKLGPDEWQGFVIVNDQVSIGLYNVSGHGTFTGTKKQLIR